VRTPGQPHSRLGEPVRAENLAVAQPALEPLLAHPSDGGRGLLAGQQRERAGVGHVQSPLQAGEDTTELGGEPVGGAGAVGDQVHAPAGEDLEVGDGLIAG
jgi:hypothetical protein